MPQISHFTKLRIALVLLFALLCAACIWNLSSLAPPKKLDRESYRLTHALSYPNWKEFPSTIDEELKLINEMKWNTPFFYRELKFWRNEIPISGIFKLSKIEKNKLVDILKGSSHPVKAKTTGAALTELANSVKGKPGAWFPLYNRAVLNLEKGQGPAAEQDLNKALTILDEVYLKIGDKTARARKDKEIVNEAYIATHYALGLTINLGTMRRRKAITHFRRAVNHMQRLLNLNSPRYAHVPEKQTFFVLAHTKMNTRFIWNDLIASYISNPDFDNCKNAPDEPGAVSCDEYRDKTLKEALEKLTGSRFEAPYRNSHTRFLKSSKDEYLVWALSNLVEISMRDRDMSKDPFLLYNSALTLIKLGHFKEATDFLNLLPDRDKDQINHEKQVDINKMTTLLAIFSGQSKLPIRGNRKNSTTPSRYREEFIALVEENGDHTGDFTSVSSCFDDFHTESRIDNWLFIRRWKALIKRGLFSQFQEEHTEIVNLFKEKEDDTYTGTLENWKRHVDMEFINNARLRLQKLSGKEGEELANVIKEFVWSNPHFHKDALNHFPPKEISERSKWIAFWGISFCLYLLGAASLCRAYNKTFSADYMKAKKAHARFAVN